MTDPKPTASVKKRKLVPLDDDWLSPKSSRSTTPVSSSDRGEDPKAHNGRIRSQPHVEGLWPTHIYLNVKVPKELEATIKEATKRTKWHSMLEEDENGQDMLYLHMSLSRPLMIKWEDHEVLKQHLQLVAYNHDPISVSFSHFACLYNDEKTRKFICTEVGRGHELLLKLLKEVDEKLKELKHPCYYEEPRFHCSISWSLTDQSSNDLKENNNENTLESSEMIASNGNSDNNGNEQEKELIQELNDQFGSNLRRKFVQINDICLKIGKQNWTYSFN